jgi:hypothetical protein
MSEIEWVDIDDCCKAAQILFDCLEVQADMIHVLKNRLRTQEKRARVIIAKLHRQAERIEKLEVQNAWKQ